MLKHKTITTNIALSVINIKFEIEKIILNIELLKKIVIEENLIKPYEKRSNINHNKL